MTHLLFEHYAKLTEFLGHTLGPDYEVSLHDLADPKGAIVAIANNHVSGREIGAPLTAMGMKLLENKSYEGRDSILHYRDRAENGHTLRASALFIRENGELAAMLCILFDDQRFRNLSEDILRLCHPDHYVETRFQMATERIPASPANQEGSPALTSSHATAAGLAASTELGRMGIPADRLTSQERSAIIASLKAQGLFQVKGAVKDVATVLACSPASIYRYLGQQKNPSIKPTAK